MLLRKSLRWMMLVRVSLRRQLMRRQLIRGLRCNKTRLEWESRCRIEEAYSEMILYKIFGGVRVVV